MPAKILLVDDETDAEELFRQKFRRELRRGDITFDFAPSGERALELLEEESPPAVLVVLSDINMPGMSGIDLLGAVKHRWPALPVILISAYGDGGTAIAAREHGAWELMPKPVDFDRLRATLADLSAQAA